MAGRKTQSLACCQVNLGDFVKESAVCLVSTKAIFATHNIGWKKKEGEEE